ncbi:unnamed protein product [Adineta ricciae]|uniref:Uncharacterized protein n=1 Tax=Adineta ricciae TaxID=249248 RepID=A0A813XM59_ADIRI|nr:unnamed protein product [Adineta ricciae]CAF1317471.1 unnamed protein product [Adineta ricciae]
MRGILHLFLIVTTFAVVVQCQGGGGSRSSRSSSFSRSRRSISSYRSSSPCTGDACPPEHNPTIGYAIIGTVGIVFLFIAYKSITSGTPSQSNTAYVNLPSTDNQNVDRNPFESGLWSNRYYQYNSWHGPFHFRLLFDPETPTVTGNGIDDVGEYEIEGMYSRKSNRMGLIKNYRQGTGDRTQNLGHNVTIQVAWNETQQQFEGKWFVKTSKYRGEDKFELKFEQNIKMKDY